MDNWELKCPKCGKTTPIRFGMRIWRCDLCCLPLEVQWDFLPMFTNGSLLVELEVKPYSFDWCKEQL